MKFIFPILFLLIFGLELIAQNVPPDKGYGITSDSTESNYQNLDAMGGPKSIGAQLNADNQKKESFFRIPIRVTKPWYDWKKRFQEKTGIQIGINYTAVFMRSSTVIDESENNADASSGIFDIQLGWNLIGRKSGKNKGTLFFKVNSRHSYNGNRTAPMFHGIFESGYYGLPAVGFNNYSFRTLELNWQQSLVNDKLTIVLGKIDLTNYFNFHGLVVPWTSFLGYGASVSGTVNWPNQGLGLAVGYKFTDKIYAMAAVADVFGDKLANGDFLDFGDNFFNGDVISMFEIGFVPSMPERYFKKVSLTYWNSSPYTSASGDAISEGQGIAFTSHWFFQERYAPYIRFAFSNGNGENAFYKKDIQIGNGFIFRSHDLVGLAFSWAETNIPDSKDQMTLEIYYRFHLTEHLAITPDYQLIINPTFNPNVSNLSYFGIRGRITL